MESAAKKLELEHEIDDQKETMPSTSVFRSNVDFSRQLANFISSNAKINFRNIERPDLRLGHCETFLPKLLADSLFQFCERNLNYAEGTKVRVYGKWHEIKRKQAAYGDDGVMYEFSGTKVNAEPWPKELDELRRYISDVTNVQFNFVLVNRYADGNDYIGEHRDDESELDPTACIASLSVGQCRDFVFRHKNVVRKLERTKQETSLEPLLPAKVVLQLKHGSLLLMHPPTNHNWYHSLPKRKGVVGTRINFTFRKVM